MNQIYKVIWSRVKHCYVVVSEIAGRCGKNGGTASEKKSMPVRAFLCALAITGCLLPGMAGASFHGGIGATTATANSIAVGDDAKTTEEYTIALGSRSRAINIYAIAMGDQAQATGQGATAIGSLSKSTAEHSLAVGDQAEAAAVNSSAYGILSKALSSHSVAIGNGASVGKGDPDSVSSQNGIAIGNGANVTVNPATATPGITDKSGGIAIGHDATTKDINTIALGTGTIGQGAQAVAIGRNARTIANNGVAIGNEARTQSTNGFALGNNARAGFDENNVLVGNDNDQAFGSNARAWGGSSMAFGNNAKAANGGAIAMGNGSQSRGDWGVAIGNGAKALAAGARALGANSNASGVNAAAIGWDSEASGASSIAVGETVKSTGTNSVAIGTGAKAANENAIALGAGSETAAAVATPSATINGTAHNFAGVNPASTVSVGKAGSERTITNVAAGRISAASTDAINGSQLYAVTSEIDKGVAYAGDVKGAGAAANKFTRKLGEQTNIVGGVADTSKLTDGNIGVVSNGTDTLNIKLAKNVKVDSVTTGNTVINNNGLTVGGKTYVTNNGINANNQTITNVASGGNTTTNAANIGDVQTAVNNAVTNVTNTLTAKGLDFEGNDGAANKVHRDLGTKLTVKGGLADVTTGVSGKNLGVKKNAAGDGLDLVMSEKPEFKEVTAGTGTNKVVINDNGVHVGGKTYINNSGLNANNQKITNVATGTAGTDAV
ncbi:ESPR-type extended signal peptide-containing protein, partial [Dialister invisus]